MKLSGKEIKACLASRQREGWVLMGSVIPQKAVDPKDLDDDEEYDTDNIPLLMHKHISNPITFEEAYQDFMSKRRTEKIHRKAQPVQAIVEDGDRIKELAAQINSLQHACMTGAKFEIEHDPNLATPKHVRNGIDSMMVQHAALAELMIQKGVITRVEYMEMLVKMWTDEMNRYQQRLSNEYGVNVKLV